MCTFSEDYCLGNRYHLVGEMAMYFRHLKLLDYTLVEVSAFTPESPVYFF